MKWKVKAKLVPVVMGTVRAVTPKLGEKLWGAVLGTAEILCRTLELQASGGEPQLQDETPLPRSGVLLCILDLSLHVSFFLTSSVASVSAAASWSSTSEALLSALRLLTAAIWPLVALSSSNVSSSVLLEFIKRLLALEAALDSSV